jgi:hypothetical protein
MNKRQWTIVAATAIPAALLQVLGIGLIILNSQVASLVGGFLMLIAGTVLLAFSLEYCALAKGRMGVWALAALLGPFGLLTTLLPKKSSFEESAAAPIQKRKQISVAGVIVSVLVTAGFVWAAQQWYNRNSSPAAVPVEDMKANEVAVFLNLQLISQAQKRYKEKDWDRDGKKTYADYFIHLWTSVGTDGRPIPVGLISKTLGFAMEPRRAINGYYFADVHERVLPGNKGTLPLNHEKEWAVMAVPASNITLSALNFFLADNSGSIFVMNTKYVPLQYPGDPLANGWTKIDTVAQLKEFQKKITYPNNNVQGW